MDLRVDLLLTVELANRIDLWRARVKELKGSSKIT